MASIPKMEYVPGFSLHFPKELSYGYVRFKGKVCPIGYLSLAKLNWDSQLGKLFSLPSQRNFPISFKPKVAIAKFIGKMQRKIWYYENRVGRHASFPHRQSVKGVMFCTFGDLSTYMVSINYRRFVEKFLHSGILSNNQESQYSLEVNITKLYYHLVEIFVDSYSFNVLV